MSFIVCVRSRTDKFFIESVAFSGASFGSGSGSISLDDVECSGGEHSLLDCTYASTSNCGHEKDVGVRCQSMRN